MGKLKESLANATKLVAALEKPIETMVKKLGVLKDEVSEWKEGSFVGIDELAIYLLEKLKKAGIDFKSVQNSLLKEYSDDNIAHYIKGVQFALDEAGKYHTQLMTLVNDQGFDRSLNTVADLLADIAKQIRKKKKQLIQSKKFKTKINGYDADLEKLETKVAALQTTVVDARKNLPPSRQYLEQNFGVNEEWKLRDIVDMITMKKAKLYAEYNSLILKLDQSILEIRKEAEFAEVMRTIKEMVADADDMENE